MRCKTCLCWRLPLPHAANACRVDKSLQDCLFIAPTRTTSCLRVFFRPALALVGQRRSPEGSWIPAFVLSLNGVLFKGRWLTGRLRIQSRHAVIRTSRFALGDQAARVTPSTGGHEGIKVCVVCMRHVFIAESPRLSRAHLTVLSTLLTGGSRLRVFGAELAHYALPVRHLLVTRQGIGMGGRLLLEFASMNAQGTSRLAAMDRPRRERLRGLCMVALYISLSVIAAF